MLARDGAQTAGRRQLHLFRSHHHAGRGRRGQQRASSFQVQGAGAAQQGASAAQQGEQGDAGQASHR